MFKKKRVSTQTAPAGCAMCGKLPGRISVTAEVYEAFLDGKCATCYLTFNTIRWSPLHGDIDIKSWN